MMKLFLCAVLLLSQGWAQQCITKTPSITIYPSTGESLQWDLKEEFFDGLELTYSVSDDNEFTIVPPLAAADQAQAYPGGTTTILNTAASTFQNNGAWNNNFALLSKQDTTFNVVWASGTSYQSRVSPVFSQTTKVTDDASTNCFTVNYLNLASSLVDCHADGHDYFFVVDAQESKKFEVPVTIPYTNISKRITRVHTYQGLKDTTYVFRGVPSYGTTDSTKWGESVIEVFVLDDKMQPQATGNLLDKATLAALLKDVPADFTFDLVDFKITPDGLIHVLDEYTRFYRLQYNNNGLWTLVSHYTEETMQSYAFSVNNFLNDQGRYTTHVAILFNEFFYYYEWNTDQAQPTKKQLFTTDFVSGQPAGTFEITQDFVVAHNAANNYLFVYSTKTVQQLIYADLQVPTNVLVNPYYPIVVTLSPTQSEAWSLSNGELRLKQATTAQPMTKVTLTAKASDGSSCSVVINYQVLDKSDFSIVSLGEQPVPDAITDFSSHLTIDGIASGPNLNYEASSGGETTFTPHQFWQLQVSENTNGFPVAKDVTFMEVLAMDDPLSFVNIVQTVDNNISLWICKGQEFLQDKYSCRQLGTIEAAKQATLQTFQAWLFNDQITVAVLSADNSLSVYTCDADDECKLMFTQTYQDKVAITSFLFVRSYLWVLRGEAKTVDIFKLDSELKLVKTINSDTLVAQGLPKEQFVPRKLYGNKQLNPSLVMIDNTDNLLVLDYHTDLTLVTLIKYSLADPTLVVDLALAKNTFFLVQKSDKSQSIQEYNYQDLSNIYLQKEVYLYWFDIQLPLQTDYAVKNGFFFVRALCVKCAKTMVLVWRPETLQHDALYKVIPTGELVPDNTPIIMAASGDAVMYVVLKVGDTISHWALLKEPLLTVNPAFDQDHFNTKVTLNLTVSNFAFDGNQPLTVLDDTNLLNTQSNVAIDMNKLAVQASDLLEIKKSTKNKVVSLSNSWYSGQVVDFKLSCDDCGSKIYFQNYLNKLQLPFSYEKARDFTVFKGMFLFLTADTIFAVKNNQPAAPLVRLETPTTDYQCSLITNDDSGLFLVAICQDSQHVYAQIVSCLSGNDCFPTGSVVLPDVKQVSKASVINNTLVVLDNNYVNPTEYPGQLVGFQLSTAFPSWNVLKLFSIDQNYLKSTAHLANYDMVTLTKNDKTVYKFLLTDADSGVYAVDFYFNGNDLVQTTPVQHADLYSYLNKQGQYASPATEFLGLRVTQTTLSSDTNTLNVRFVVTTSDVAHFALNVDFDVTNPMTESKMTPQGLDYVLNRYGNWQTVNKVKQANGYVAIPYVNTDKSQVVYAVYNTQDVTDLSQQFVSMVGGVSVETELFPTLAMEFQVVQGVQQLILNAPNSYTLANELAFVIEDGQSIEDQIATLEASNDFTTFTQKFEITKEGEIHPCTAKVSSLNLLYSTNEYKQWSIREVFFTGSELSYKLSDNTDFDVIQPLTSADTPKQHKSANIVQAVPVTYQKNGAWTNNFVFLSQDDTVASLYWAMGNTLNTRTSPEFNVIQKVKDTKDITCFGFDVLASGVDAIVDCHDPTKQKDYFYVANRDSQQSPQKYEAPVTFQYKDITKRIVHTRVLQSINKSVTQLFRAVSSYGTTDQQRIGRSVIEVFVLDEQNTPIFTGDVLDTATLASLLSVVPADFQFSLVDFKVMADGTIYVLDQQNGLYRIDYESNGTWKLLGQVEVKGQSYAFDVNNFLNQKTGGYTTHIAIQFYDYFVLYEWATKDATPSKTTLYQLDFTAQPFQAFDISQGYILVQNQKTLQFFTLDDTKPLVSAKLDSAVTALVNPFIPVVLTLSQTESHAWALSDGYLVLKKHSEPVQNKKVTLSAVTPKNDCNVNISFTILQSDDVQTYAVEGTTPLPSFVQDPTSHYPLENLAQGPNLNYQTPTAQNGGVTFNTHQFWQLQVNAVNDTLSNDVVFTEVLALDDPLAYIYITQSSQYVYSIWKCQGEQFLQPQTKCKKLGTFTTQLQASLQTFQAWLFTDQISVAALRDANTLVLYTCDFDDECQEFTTIAYKDTPINSFVFAQSYLWVLTGTTKTIDVYKLADVLTKVKSVTSATIQEEGLNPSDWQPRKIFGNKALNPNQVFVDSTASLMLLDYHTELTVVGQIAYNGDYTVDVAVANETFFLLKQNTTTTTIDEYNYQDLSNIYKLKTLETYWYIPQTPLTTDFCVKNGYLFVRALSQKDQKTVILVFIPNTDTHDQLYKVIPTGQLIADGTPMLLTAAGNAIMYVVLKIGDVVSQWALLKETLLTVNPVFTTTNLIQKSKLELTISNYEGTQPLTITQDLTLINTNDQVSVDAKSIAEVKDGKLKVQQDDKEQFVAIDSKFYNGQVLRFDLQCEACGTQVSFQNYLDSANLETSYPNVTDFTWFNNNLAWVTPKTLYFTKQNKASLPAINFVKDQVCSLITNADDDSYLVAICSDTEAVYVQVLSCTKEQCSAPKDAYKLDGVKQVSKATVIANTLIVLDNDWVNPTSYEGTLVGFKMVAGEQDQWTLTKLFTIDSKYLQASNLVHLANFDVATLSQQGLPTLYKFLLTDASSGLFFVDFLVQNHILTQSTPVEALNLYTYLNSENAGQFASQDTQYLGVRIMAQEFVHDKASLTVNAIVTTSNVPHYVLSFTFDVSHPATKTKLLQTSVLYALNRYGNWQTINKVKQHLGTIAIPYYNQQSGQVVLGAYQTQQSSNGQTIMMQGGVELVVQDLNKLAMEFQTVANQNQVVLSNNQSVNVNSGLGVKIAAKADFKEQTATLTARNAFSSSQTQFAITPQGIVSDNESSWKWWMTLLIVLGVILAGVIGFFVYKHFAGEGKRNQTVDSGRENLLGDEENLAHVQNQNRK